MYTIISILHTSILAGLLSQAYLIKEIAFLIFKKSFWHYDGLRVALLNPLLSSSLHEDKCCVHDTVERYNKEEKTTQIRPGVWFLVPWLEKKVWCLSGLSNKAENASLSWALNTGSILYLILFFERSVLKANLSVNYFWLALCRLFVGEDDSGMIQLLSAISRILKPEDMQITRLYSLSLFISLSIEAQLSHSCTKADVKTLHKCYH